MTRSNDNRSDSSDRHVSAHIEVRGDVSQSSIYAAGRDVVVYQANPDKTPGLAYTPKHVDTIPRTLVDQVRDGRTVLFVGRGGVEDAADQNGRKFPTLEGIKRSVVQRFLDETFSSYPLSQVMELAMSESSPLEVQEHVASLYRNIYPADYHQLITEFVWQAIVTTNIDLVIERTYSASKTKIQRPVVFKKNGEKVEEKLKDIDNVILLKLYGCVTDIADDKSPLQLTSDQYSSFQGSRSRLFERVESLAYEFPFIVIGKSLADDDVRTILKLISQISSTRPRSYIVVPNMTPAEVRFWESQRFTCIGATFEDLLRELDHQIPTGLRAVANVVNIEDHPISRHFTTSDKPSSHLLSFLTKDTEYIHRDYKTSRVDPKDFYRGYFRDLTPIILNLDVRRAITDSILSGVFLATESERSQREEFYLIKGHAGAGKSVLLRRLAWDAATDYELLCLAVSRSGPIEYEPLSELHRLTQQRIFLFVDPVNEYIDSIEYVLTEARKDHLPVTIIGAERESVWNTSCGALEPFLTDEYVVRYLSEVEILELIALLSRHKSLGHLEGLPVEQQLQALAKHAGRQLLVALHEATLGKPFREIVLDEFNAIVSEKAKSLYLTVCIFHRLGVPVRAGLISRVHHIPFTMFEQELFKPLESIVFAQYDNSLRDYVYRSRHSHIAEMVFEEVLVEDDTRFDEYIRLLSAIDIDYSSDYETFKGLTNAGQLLELYDRTELIHQVYEVARNRVGDHPMLLQQEAIFEMRRPDGDLDRATELLRTANKLAPYYKPIDHSLAVLARKKAETAHTKLEQNKYREEAKSAARRLIQEGTVTGHPYHTLIEVCIDELQDLMDSLDEYQVERKVKEIEEQITRATQLFPEESHILEQESRFNELLDKHNHALQALEKAFARNKRNIFIALRLAKMYQRDDNLVKAILTLRECADLNPDDKDINFQLARMLMQKDDSLTPEIRHHLRRGFTFGDSNHTAQFYYARLLYLEGEVAESDRIFRNLADANVDNRVKRKPREKVFREGVPLRYSGVILRLESSYAFIRNDKYQNDIYTHKEYSDQHKWEELAYHERVTFELAFNYRGPVAVNVYREV